MAIFADADPHRHACKAVKTGLEILHRTETLNGQLHGSFAPMAVHSGINSGLALVGFTKLEGASGVRWTYTASGLVTIVAARIAALAQGGMVLIGAETAQRVAESFSLKEIGSKQLKNLREEVMVYQILGEAGFPQSP